MKLEQFKAPNQQQKQQQVNKSMTDDKLPVGALSLRAFLRLHTAHKNQ